MVLELAWNVEMPLTLKKMPFDVYSSRKRAVRDRLCECLGYGIL